MIKLKDILNEVERLGIDTPIRDGVAFGKMVNHLHKQLKL